MRQLPLAVRLRAGATLDSFVPGHNVEVLSALRGRGNVPLWLWGGHGSGKTHLLQAMCAAAGVRADAAAGAGADATAGAEAAADAAGAATGAGAGADATPDAAAAYFALEREGLPPEALQGFSASRVLCLDDVGSVAGREDWERALFRTFNEALDLGTRLLFAADAAPRRYEWCLDDWRSRAAACVVYQVHELDDIGRVEALRLRAMERGLQLPQETADYLLRRLPRDLKTLYEILDLLDEASLIAQRRLTVPFIRDALERFAETRPSHKTS